MRRITNNMEVDEAGPVQQLTFQSQILLRKVRTMSLAWVVLALKGFSVLFP